MKIPFAVLALSAILAAPAALAAPGDATAGAQKAVVCGACHGADGNSFNPEWPSLAGQHADYIAAQLALFKQGVRDNPLMMPMALPLSDEDMADLGAYFAAQARQGLKADPSNYREGERLYRDGDRARDLPACLACHGPQGKGNAAAQYPAVQGQHATYAHAQLKAYASGARKPVANDIMQVVAARLSDEEMRAVASYMQGLR